MEWIKLWFSNPYNDPQGLVGYLGVPFAFSTTLALLLPRRKDVTWIAFFSSLIAFFAIFILLFGSSSTISIGIMFALVPFGMVCAVTVAVVRMLQRSLKQR